MFRGLPLYIFGKYACGYFRVAGWPTGAADEKPAMLLKPFVGLVVWGE